MVSGYTGSTNAFYIVVLLQFLGEQMNRPTLLGFLLLLFLAPSVPSSARENSLSATSTRDISRCRVGDHSIITYRLRKIGASRKQQCALLSISSKGEPVLWVKALGRQFTDAEIPKLTLQKATELFGEQSTGTSSFNLIGWRGDGDPEIFHIQMKFPGDGFCSGYRIRGPLVKPVWINFDKRGRTVFPELTEEVDQYYDSCDAESSLKPHRVINTPAQPNVPNFQ